MTDPSEHTPGPGIDRCGYLESQIKSAVKHLKIRDHQLEMVQQQLAACRAALAEANAGAAGKLRGELDGLRALVQRTLNYHRRTDSTCTVNDIITDLRAGLVEAALEPYK
ncbi:hypothetical protein LCGC14_2750290 [marine sediment metagenome]|uniref:Uncharacterized protein n=1 Tax=marine sediment metagenome TaxID=412755 RepID=A0A0F8Z258_9ZZZZ